jgi:hypothetical protein
MLVRWRTLTYRKCPIDSAREIYDHGWPSEVSQHGYIYRRRIHSHHCWRGGCLRLCSLSWRRRRPNCSVAFRTEKAKGISLEDVWRLSFLAVIWIAALRKSEKTATTRAAGMLGVSPSSVRSGLHQRDLLLLLLSLRLPIR